MTRIPHSPPPAEYRPGDRHVPVDRRWFGMDRRSFLPAAGVAVVAVALSTVLPAVNSAVAPSDPVVAGDVLELDGGITFVPALGWNVVSGVREPDASGAYPTAAIVDSADNRVTVSTLPYDGDAPALLDRLRIEPAVIGGDSEPTTVTTRSGLTGVTLTYRRTDLDATIAALVSDNGIGIQVVSVGPPDAWDTTTGPDVLRMIDSISDTGRPTA